MKSLLLFVLTILQAMAYSQLTFEEVASPKGFNILAVRQSPIGEYFMQAVNDRESIYTSLNGQDWINKPLPELHVLDEIQFFSDGTPVLKGDDDEHLIRRNDQWVSMNMTAGYGDIEASFIKDDTLFVFQDQTFGYSLDKGQTFTIVFAHPGGISDQSANLWKFDHHYVLHHTAGASDYLSVFNEVGERVLYRALSVGFPAFTYNECGQLLITDYDSYYLFKENGLIFNHGPATDIIPAYTSNSEIFSQDGHYYHRVGNTIYKNTGCDFNWQPLVTNDLIGHVNYLWINHQADLFLWDRGSDYFVLNLSGSSIWEEQYPVINSALVYTINESIKSDQVSVTSNALFCKKSTDPDWVKRDTLGVYSFETQYSPDGDLYVNRRSDIQYSSDNGITFSTIELPETGFFTKTYSMYVLDNDILMITDGLFGRSFYSLNNGHDWVQTDLSFYATAPFVKLAKNYIIIAELEYDYEISRINIANGEIETEAVGDFFNLNFYGSAILDDGTVYFQGFDVSGLNPEGLYRFTFGEGLEFVGQFDELANVYAFAGAGTDLVAFSYNTYYVFDGSSLEVFNYTGLSVNSYSTFTVASNQYVYVIQDNQRIFRSTKPLSSPHYISGNIYHDANKDCINDTLDTSLKYWQVKVEGDDFMRIRTANSEGKFNFSVPAGDYTISSKSVSEYWDVCTSSYTVNVNENNPIAYQNFQAQGLTSCANLEVDFSTPLIRRCFDNYYSIRVRNTGPGASLGTKLTLQLDPYFDFISATIPYTLVGDSIVLFDLGILEVNDEISFRIFFNLSCDADLGIEHCLTGILSDDNICGNTRSTYTECQENIGSFDPNDKRVFNGNGVESATFDKGDYIYYHIRFQNTGTDTAFTVRILDPLSPKLDLSTLEMLSASHPYVYELTDGPALEIAFNNILLPDSSTNEAASHGFIKFRIKPFPQFDYGTMIPNQAGIFFDFNAPIYTNDATILLQNPVSTKDPIDGIDFNIFPNPTSAVITLVVSESDLSRIDAIEVVDHLGRRIHQSRVLNSNTISVAHFIPGVYVLILRENGQIIGRRQFAKF